MSHLLDKLLGLHGLTVYLIVGGLVFAEDVLFLGFVIPGETAAVLGGVAASRGHVSLALMCATVVLAAIIGDSVGYQIGVRYGQRLLSLPMLRRRTTRIDATRDTLAHRGGPAVFVGRFIGFLRVVMPFLAGASHMRYRRFVVYNGAGGIVWGIAVVLLGFLAGNSYAAVEKASGRAAVLVAAVVVIAGLIVWRIRRHRHAPTSEASTGPSPAQNQHDACRHRRVGPPQASGWPAGGCSTLASSHSMPRIDSVAVKPESVPPSKP